MNILVQAFAALITILVMEQAISSPQELPCPDDCIAAFNFVAKENSRVIDLQGAINDITDELARRGHNDIANISIQKNKTVYVVFKDSCEERDQKLEKLLEAVFAFVNPGLEYVMLPGPFKRGRSTIVFRGEYWDECRCCGQLKACDQDQR